MTDRNRLPDYERPQSFAAPAIVNLALSLAITVVLAALFGWLR